MSKYFFIYAIILLSFGCDIKAQNFLEVKYSINDIKKQRENFKNEKIKSISFKNSSREIKLELDSNGKFIEEIEVNGNFYKRFNYSLDNLISYNATADMNTYYNFDLNGNVVREYDDVCCSNSFSYDSKNRLVSMDSESEEGEVCPFEKIIYEDLLIKK